jgi:hypothetical protein
MSADVLHVSSILKPTFLLNSFNGVFRPTLHN